ncbi:MAG: Peptide chain release factor 3 [Candidatus Anoxychlamydiales bacterium]|nr:Peptide chain release factor 3 [Candidatus Anoxychlamydiales bacterium]
MTEKDLLKKEVEKRRTFAIISHPDAGKTTLTEKLLLYSGMLTTAGMVKGRKGRKAAASDWMAMEQERGISITSSAMQFSYKDVIINVLDTPGHEDFSEDTYRTLTAADCAIMVIDASKGVEKQTLKLFEVCRLREIPVLTFINKMDLYGRNPIDLMSEVENVLKIDSYAMNWPIGSGKEFQGIVDRRKKQCQFFLRTPKSGSQKTDIFTYPLDSAETKSKLSEMEYKELLEEIELLELAGNSFSIKDFLAGKVTPVFFASALINFGVEFFFDAFIHLAPCPHKRKANLIDGMEIEIDPVKDPFSGYVFKLQANMDKRHRDSTAFIRICSGRFEKDLVVKNTRLKKQIRLSRPHGMLAGQRTTIEIGYPGDIIGVINPSFFSIGDTISLSGNFNFKPLPQFQPELFARIQPKDVGKRKAFDKGVHQLIEEGAIQMLKTDQGDLIFAAVGQLQFEVMQYRLKDEYKVETIFTPLSYKCSAWILGDIKTFKKSTTSRLVKDRHDHPMVIFDSTFDKQYTIDKNPDHRFVDVLF